MKINIKRNSKKKKHPLSQIINHMDMKIAI